MHTIKSFMTKPIGRLASYLLNKYWPRKNQYALHIHIGEANVLSKHDIKMYLASHIFIRSNPMWRCFSNYGFWIDRLWISSTRKPRKTRQRPPWGMSNLLIYYFFSPLGGEFSYLWKENDGTASSLTVTQYFSSIICTVKIIVCHFKEFVRHESHDDEWRVILNSQTILLKKYLTFLLSYRTTFF